MTSLSPAYRSKTRAIREAMDDSIHPDGIRAIESLWSSELFFDRKALHMELASLCCPKLLSGLRAQHDAASLSKRRIMRLALAPSAGALALGATTGPLGAQTPKAAQFHAKKTAASQELILLEADNFNIDLTEHSAALAFLGRQDVNAAVRSRQRSQPGSEPPAEASQEDVELIRESMRTFDLAFQMEAKGHMLNRLAQWDRRLSTAEEAGLAFALPAARGQDQPFSPSKAAFGAWNVVKDAISNSLEDIDAEKLARLSRESGALDGELPKLIASLKAAYRFEIELNCQLEGLAAKALWKAFDGPQMIGKLGDGLLARRISEMIRCRDPNAAMAQASRILQSFEIDEAAIESKLEPKAKPRI